VVAADEEAEILRDGVEEVAGAARQRAAEGGVVAGKQEFKSCPRSPSRLLKNVRS
jgi:hypothetical protein